jgi:cysteinyl-tRNA synthetase
MKLYNTLTKKVEQIVPLDEGRVKLFVCGPTVYDFVHVGNAKTYVQFDVLARVLRYSGFDVFYLQNITDIDDKIILRAKEQRTSWDALRSKYEKEYMLDMKRLSNTAVTSYARATDYIDDIIRQVQTLLDKGHAYKTEDGVYFEIATFPEYGKLSGRTEVKEDDAETRVDQSEQKRGWNDFCLWKFSKPGEPVWSAPFGNGRPGWHIEDTAITEHHFGPQYDIHGGAVDLIFPHHEAEITQMESASGLKPFVKYWVHTGFLKVNDRRMGKSLGNFHTIREVLEKGYDPLALRLFMLQGHYRSPINFSWENLDAAQNRLKDIRGFADLRFQTITKNPGNSTKPLQGLAFDRALADITSAVTNDLNTPEALAILGRLITDAEMSGIDSSAQKAYDKFLKNLDRLFGLNLLHSTDISPEQKQLLRDRQKAREAHEWTKADKLRDKLAQHGIDIRDTPIGPVWSRKPS